MLCSGVVLYHDVSTVLIAGLPVNLVVASMEPTVVADGMVVGGVVVLSVVVAKVVISGWKQGCVTDISQLVIAITQELLQYKLYFISELGSH